MNIESIIPGQRVKATSDLSAAENIGKTPIIPAGTAGRVGRIDISAKLVEVNFGEQYGRVSVAPDKLNPQ